MNSVIIHNYFECAFLVAPLDYMTPYEVQELYEEDHFPIGIKYPSVTPSTTCCHEENDLFGDASYESYDLPDGFVDETEYDFVDNLGDGYVEDSEYDFVEDSDLMEEDFSQESYVNVNPR